MTQYFFEKCPAKIVGVTGTKGKGTTSSLIFEMVKGWFEGGKIDGERNVFLGGNIGTSPLDFLDKLKADDLVILELSSFQLQDVKASPHVAVVLGISEDHLDQHVSFDEYIEAKKNILRFQGAGDIAVIDVDNEITAGFVESAVGMAEFAGRRVFEVSNLKITESQYSGFVKRGAMMVSDGAANVCVGDVEKTKLRGLHNIKNMLMAAATAHAVGVPVEFISKVISSWAGLPHRLQLVCERDGVRFYNDSASTNPSTTIAAVRSFKEPLTLIAGGSEKNLDFTPLGEEIALRLNIKRVILMGQTKEKIGEAIEKAVATNLNLNVPTKKRKIPLEMIFADTYMEAFMVAKLTAEPGDVVLLSPGCASFGLFKNYIERGEIFSRFVME